MHRLYDIRSLICYIGLTIGLTVGPEWTQPVGGGGLESVRGKARLQGRQRGYCSTPLCILIFESGNAMIDFLGCGVIASLLLYVIFKVYFHGCVSCTNSLDFIRKRGTYNISS